jgi:hypothetical protein
VQRLGDDDLPEPSMPKRAKHSTSKPRPAQESPQEAPAQAQPLPIDPDTSTNDISEELRLFLQFQKQYEQQIRKLRLDELERFKKSRKPQRLSSKQQRLSRLKENALQQLNKIYAEHPELETTADDRFRATFMQIIEPVIAEQTKGLNFREFCKTFNDSPLPSNCSAADVIKRLNAIRRSSHPDKAINLPMAERTELECIFQRCTDAIEKLRRSGNVNAVVFKE